MTTDDLLKLAADNLHDTMVKLEEIARRPGYLNIATPEIKELNEALIYQFTLCFTLKNAIHDLTL